MLLGLHLGYIPNCPYVQTPCITFAICNNETDGGYICSASS